MTHTIYYPSEVVGPNFNGAHYCCARPAFLATFHYFPTGALIYIFLYNGELARIAVLESGCSAKAIIYMTTALLAANMKRDMNSK